MPIRQLKIIILITLSAGLLLVLSFFYYQKHAWQHFVRDHQVIKISLKKHFFAPAQEKLVVEVVKSQPAIAQGLAGRSDLLTAQGQKIDGLLFVYPQASQLTFWMKEMQFPIDICWFNQAELISCERNASIPDENQAPETLSLYHSPTPANLVLETKPGKITHFSLAKLFFNSLY